MNHVSTGQARLWLLAVWFEVRQSPGLKGGASLYKTKQKEDHLKDEENSEKALDLRSCVDRRRRY